MTNMNLIKHVPRDPENPAYVQWFHANQEDEYEEVNFKNYLTNKLVKLTYFKSSLKNLALLL